MVAQGDVKLDYKKEKLVEMSNGCICCTLREDLLINVRELGEHATRLTRKRLHVPHALHCVRL
jgi:G3E family GTPase